MGQQNKTKIVAVGPIGSLKVSTVEAACRRSGNLEMRGPGNPEIWRSGDLEIQKSGVQKIENIKNLKIQIRSAQNVGKVWISRKKSSWPYLGPSEVIFSMDRKNAKNANFFSYFPWWANGPYSPGVGQCDLHTASTLW